MSHKHAKNRARDSKRAAQRQLAEAKSGIEREIWVPPGQGECDETETIVDFANDTTKVIQRLSYLNGRLIYYAMMHFVFDRRDWHEVTRIDCSHGTVHQHRFGRSGVSSTTLVHIQSLHSASDVGRTYDSSYKAIYDNLHENERRWRDG